MEIARKLIRPGAGASMILRASELVRRATNRIRPPTPIFKLLNRNKPRFECPICGYCGPFADFDSFAGRRKHAVCPRCGALERHRIQYMVVMDLMKRVRFGEMKMLHIAPEKFFRAIFSRQFSKYETADLFMEGVDHKADIRNLPFPDGAYDFIFASHVLEHISEDRDAISEIRRVLRPGGVAILPVPIVCEKTIEYSEPNPFEGDHVRAPGPDYFDKYREYFRRVDVHRSDSFPENYQLFIYEDRSRWPTPECPLRPPMRGTRHMDFVPVCHV